jgi:multimeric flavodoxin WrbA
MSKKLVAFNGSPRKRGYSSSLVAEAIRGAESEGAEVKLYNLNEKNIRGCQGCYYCRANEGCSIKNDLLAPMYEDIKNADGILIGTPIYQLDIAGQTKILLDRFFPMTSGFAFIPRYPNKKVGTIFAQGAPDIEEFTPRITALNQYLSSRLGWDVVGSIICAGTSDSIFKENVMRGELSKLSLKIQDDLFRNSFLMGKALMK